MCGICGEIGGGEGSRRRLREMTSALAHRGPDGFGLYQHGVAGFGHRRLAIIDLDGGKQPMTTPDGAVVIVLNGEIYNYRELRSSLEGKGYKFVTKSDTEVLLHLYQEYELECLSHLRGMFAFAMYDHPRQRLFMARDHLGQKPLFYAERDSGLLFGSEIKSILAAAPELAEMNPAALDQYLTLRLIAPPRTMMRGIRKLPPGHYLTYDPTVGIQVKRYWDIEYVPKYEADDDTLVNQLEEHLIEALQYHLVADVPVGAFVSGGLDSTLIAAMVMRHHLCDHPLQTFSLSLPHKQFDEAPFARLVADRYGTKHREFAVTPSLTRVLPKIVEQLDEPADPLAVCQYLISEMASQHVKVVLGGEGGGELFGGYDRYYGNRYANWYAAIPRSVRHHVLGPILNHLPDGTWYKSKTHQIKWLQELSFYDGGDRYAKSLGYFYFNEGWRSQLYGPRMSVEPYDPDACIREPYDHAHADNDVDRMLYADTQVRLPDHPVMILDRMTMAHGLEARAPFMDHKLAEFAARLPGRMKVRGRMTRYIQRQLAARYLPPELLSRPKQGFHSALPYMLKEEYRRLFSLFLTRSQLAEQGYFMQSAIDDLVSEHLGGKNDHGNRLWLLLNSELWYRVKIQHQTVEDLGEQMHEAEYESVSAGI